MTNYPIGPHRTPIYVILPVHITLRPMQTEWPIQTGQLRHKKTYVPKLVPYILPSNTAALTAVSLELSTQRRSVTINAVIKCTQCWSFLFIAAHYIGALRSRRIPLIRAASML